MTKFLVLILITINIQISMADDRTAVEKLSVFGKKENLPTQPGSAYLLSEEDLARFDYNDIHRVLRSVPGVNIQEEDGFGLRPNIGLRGGHPHRSKKVALMEDGVLIAPAPYSAPAAYYFPQLDKVGSVEIFKGTPATRFGPNTIGGAINLVTRINEPGGRFEFETGSFDTQKMDMQFGIETFGDFSFDYSRLSTSGFKELPDGSDTGFLRENFRLRWDKYFATLDQSITLKFNWSGEDSNETYTGLANVDFDQNPLQRYAGTELDKMLWNHRQYFANYSMSPGEDLKLKATLYHHQFDRSWDKLIGFGDGVTPAVDIRDVLKQPDIAANSFYYQILKGQANSGVLSNNRDVLNLGNNQRQYFSQGVQLGVDYEVTTFAWDHIFKLGTRFHQDGVDRFHESRFFNMTNGSMVQNAGLAQRTTLLNEGRADALTSSLSYETSYEWFSLNAITRFEDINYRQTDLATGGEILSGDELFAPGLGMFFQTTDHLGVLMGVSKAFTPVGPGQNDSIRPEEAINYELGLRYTGHVGLELVGFYSDYQNLLGTCTQSSGCLLGQLDQSFNGGAAEVWGLEFLGRHEVKTGSMTFPLQITATYTQAQFKNNFTSGLIDWGIGDVVSGDPIPYIPEFQANLMLGFEWKGFHSYLNVNYMGEMADQAVSLNREYIQSRTVYGLALAYTFNPLAKLNVRVDNLTDAEYAVSMRPFGLRPGRPQTFMVGFEYAFR